YADGDHGGHHIARRVDHRHGVVARVRDIGRFAVRGDRQSERGVAGGDHGGHHIDPRGEKRTGGAIEMWRYSSFGRGECGDGAAGVTPTGITAVTILLAVSITDTVLSLKFAT